MVLKVEEGGVAECPKLNLRDIGKWPMREYRIWDFPVLPSSPHDEATGHKSEDVGLWAHGF